MEPASKCDAGRAGSLGAGDTAKASALTVAMPTNTIAARAARDSANAAVETAADTAVVRTTSRAIAAGGIVVLAIAAAAFAAVRASGSANDVARTPGSDVVPAEVWIDDDGLRLVFDALRDREIVLDVTNPRAPRVVESPCADDVARLRAALARKLGLADLRQLVRAHGATAEELRRLGYL